MLRIETIVICFKLRGMLRFLDFSSVLFHFSHKLVQTCFALHGTWHTTLFDLYYCVEIVRIENNSHMLELTC